MNILTIPNKILTSQAEKVTDFSGMAQVIADMIQLAGENNLIGLAGNQVGLLQRIFIMNISDNEIPYFKAFINPKTKTDQTLQFHCRKFRPYDLMKRPLLSLFAVLARTLPPLRPQSEAIKPI